ETDWVMGAFMMINKRVFEGIGCFDDDFFMYSEDLDLCFRLKRNHGRVFYYADANIIHFYNQSGLKKWNNEREERVRSSTNLFFKKNYSFITSMVYSALYNLRFILKCFIKKYKRKI
ncbi:MAG TPA: hypothetical protein DD426_11160, partial [Clostridiaceae bacterium]|nr:hypothetical protein [Clostridiaceae bacterium]